MNRIPDGALSKEMLARPRLQLAVDVASLDEAISLVGYGLPTL